MGKSLINHCFQDSGTTDLDKSKLKINKRFPSKNGKLKLQYQK